MSEATLSQIVEVHQSSAPGWRTQVRQVRLSTSRGVTTMLPILLRIDLVLDEPAPDDGPLAAHRARDVGDVAVVLAEEGF
jgi:hypothetical protein